MPNYWPSTISHPYVTTKLYPESCVRPVLFQILAPFFSGRLGPWPDAHPEEERPCAHLFIQAVSIPHFAQVTADAVIHRLLAPGDIACDNRAADSGGFKQHIAHALMVAGQHYTVCSSIKGEGIGLETVENDNARLL